MPVLYRKYRPKTFAEVVGQNHIKVTLANEIANENLAHAYLFVGPRGTGKTTMARLFSRAINCEKRKPGQSEPCNACETCVQILAGKSLDINEIDAATHTQVDNVRDNIIASTRIPAIHPGGFKVFIIDEIHMLSKHAFNALLKTIEEPPTQVIFILATTDLYKVPETIISRCQRFDFKKIPQKLIIERLGDISGKENVRIPELILASIARKSEGCLRDAESLLGQLINVAHKGVVDEKIADVILPRSNWTTIHELVSFLQQRNLSAALGFVHERIEEGIDTESFISDCIEFVRQILLKKSIGPAYHPDFDEKTASDITKHAENFTIHELRQLLEIFMKQSIRTKNTLIPELPLELACIEFCHDAMPGSTATVAVTPEITPATPTFTSNSSISNISSDDIQKLRKGWPAMLAKLKDFNHSLSVFLKVAHPLSLTPERLVIGFKYDFHANTVGEQKNKRAAEQAFSELLGRSIAIDCIVDINYTDNHKKFSGAHDADVQDVLSIMGGEVI